MFENGITPQPFDALRKGDPRTETVQVLHAFLSSAGLTAELKDERSRGEFGPATRRAIARLQTEQLGVPASGELDASTRLHIVDFMHRQALRQRPEGFFKAVAMLFGEDGLREAQQQSADDLTRREESADPEEVQRVRQILAGRGYALSEELNNPAPGPFSDAALKAYQMELGLAPLGFIRGHVDHITGNFLQIDADEQANPSQAHTPWGSPEMQYVRPFHPARTPAANLLPPEEKDENRVELLRQLLKEITHVQDAGPKKS